jgi:hypothetical protein
MEKEASPGPLDYDAKKPLKRGPAFHMASKPKEKFTTISPGPA